MISLCISLIQEQIGRSAAIAMGVQHHVIELDVVEIIPRRNNFLTSDETPEDIAEENNTTVIAGGAVVVPDGEESNLPGEVGEDKDEDGKYFYDFQLCFSFVRKHCSFGIENDYLLFGNKLMTNNCLSKLRKMSTFKAK